MILALSLTGIITGSAQAITGFVAQYGYAAIAFLMALESSSLPVPSEIIMPLAGLLAAEGILSFTYAFIAGLVGSGIGVAVDYYIAYFIEKGVVYRNLKRFHIDERRLDSFMGWFDRNGSAAVFFAKLIPVARTLISFPAGFAKMDQKKFFLYSIVGSAIWDAVLMAFGFYFLKTDASNVVWTMAAIGIFAVALYFVYKIGMKRLGKKNDSGKRRDNKQEVIKVSKYWNRVWPEAPED